MEVLIHFLNGNDLLTQDHYAEKEYRNDVIVEIDGLFYEVYFYVEGAIHYEMRKDGFFAFPGLIVLDEISNEKIYNAINILLDYRYFDCFNGKENISLNERFMNRWYINDLSINKLENSYSYKLR